MNHSAKNLCPTLRARGRAGALPRPRGYSPESGILPLAFFRQFPRSPLGVPWRNKKKHLTNRAKRCIFFVDTERRRFYAHESSEMGQ